MVREREAMRVDRAGVANAISPNDAGAEHAPAASRLMRRRLNRMGASKARLARRAAGEAGPHMRGWLHFPCISSQQCRRDACIAGSRLREHFPVK